MLAFGTVFFKEAMTFSATSMRLTKSAVRVDEDISLETKISSECSPKFFPGDSESLQVRPWIRNTSNLSRDQLDEEVRGLEYELLERGFEIENIRIIINTLCQVSSGVTVLLHGMLDFLKVVLSLADTSDEGSAYFVTTTVLLACIFHYFDCWIALQQGAPTQLERYLLNTLEQKKQHYHACDASGQLVLASSEIMQATKQQHAKTLTDSCDVEEGVHMIVRGAATIKRAEMMVEAILRDDASGPASARVRDLLLSLMEDWRSLGIRVVASVYRLEGILQNARMVDEYLERTPKIVKTAREAMRIYAPLAQRLGMYALKSKIEAKAFRILYRRQYRAASFMYYEGGKVMEAISEYLLTRVSVSLRSDDVLMDQLEDLQIFSRVKEPYSFWRKLLKNRMQGRLTRTSEVVNSSRSLSLNEVNDAVALRVILKAKKISVDESDQETRYREELLCYYVQNLLRQEWPETDESRLKDYIAQPKPNGYQSLHHTSKICSRGVEFPFEVQVRSEEMHKVAEFGYAAHYQYKLGSSNQISGKTLLPSPRIQSVNCYIDALVSAKNYLKQQQVNVFVLGRKQQQGKGKLISVPVNSSINDTIEHIESSMSAKVQVWRNGRLAKMSDFMENGDVIVIAI